MILVRSNTSLQDTRGIQIPDGMPTVLQGPIGPQGPQGPQGDQGPPGNLTTGGRLPALEFEGTWSTFTCEHTFPYLPDVWLVDSHGAACETDVDYPDATHVSISFPAPFTGTITVG